MKPMRLVLTLLVLSFIALFLQGAVISEILPPYLAPNLLVILVVFLAFYEVSPFGAFLSFSLGLLFDLSSGILLGPWACAFVVVFALVSSMSQRLFVESAFAAFVASFVGAMVSILVYLALVSEFLGSAAELVSLSILGSLMTALVAAPIMSLLRKLVRSADPVRVRTRSTPRRVPRVR